MIPGIVAGAPAGPTLWTPAQASLPPKLWLDRLSSVTDAGSGACSQWNDRSGNSYNATQTLSSARPSIQATGLNSQRTIRGDGTSDYMLIGASGAKDLYRNVGFGYIFFVWQRSVSTGGGVARVMFNTGTNSGNNTRFRVLVDSSTAADKITLEARRLDADSLATLQGTVSVNSGPHMCMAYMDWANRTARIYVDGALDVQNTTFTTVGSATSNTAAASSPTLFSSLAGTAFLDGDIAVLQAGSGASALSTDDIDRFFGWAAHDWGLTSLLPALHPYKTTPP